MAKFFAKGSSIYIAGSLSEHAVNVWYTEGLIEKAPRRNNMFVGPLYNLPRMLELVPDITDEKIKALADEEISRQIETEELIKYGTKGEKIGDLWEHQVLGVQLARCNKRFGYWFDTRTGKTRMMIQAMYEALVDNRCQRCLVICPTSIIPSWLKDIQEYKPELKVAAYYGSEKQKATALKTPCHIFIISMEITVKNLDLLRQIGFTYAVVDESSKLKSHKTQISKAMLEYSQELEYWYELSATPAPNNESEYYIQMRCIDPFIFPPTWSRFKQKYFVDTSRNPAFEKLVLRHDMRTEFLDVIKTKAVYIDQSIMPTAGKEWHIYSYKPEEETLKVYEEFRKNAVVELEGESLSTDMIASINSKLAQVTSGFMINTDAVNENKIMRKLGEEANRQEVYRLPSQYTPSHRATELLKLLNNFPDEQVVIWAVYKQEFADIKQVLGSECRCINGSTRTNDKFAFIKDFKAGKFKYLVCHPLSVGMGINLTEAHIAIYYSMLYSWEALKQSSERICGHITVQPKKAEYYVMSAEGTIDEQIFKNVQNKKTTSLDFLNLLRGY